MYININIVVILLGCVIAQGLFSSAVLLLNRNNRKANRYLAILLLLFSLWLCDTFFRVSGIYNQNPNLYFLPIYYSLAFGPLIYLYTCSLTYPSFRFKPKHYLHFIPVILQASLYIFLQLNSYEVRRWFWLEVHQPYTYNLEFFLSLISLIVYSTFSLKRLKNYGAQIRNSYSNLDRIRLNWLRYVHFTVIVLSLFWFGETILRIGLEYYQINPLSSICIGFSIIFLAIGALNQGNLGELNIRSKPLIGAESDELDPTILSKIQEAMERDELFLQQELTLKTFSIAIGETERKVSYHINSHLNMSFIDFVNRYRVNRVKSLIEQGNDEQFSLVGIALESGFNSKPTFNRVFKKHTNKSPSEYKKGINNGS